MSQLNGKYDSVDSSVCKCVWLLRNYTLRYNNFIIVYFLPTVHQASTLLQFVMGRIDGNLLANQCLTTGRPAQ